MATIQKAPRRRDPRRNGASADRRAARSHRGVDHTLDEMLTAAALGPGARWFPGVAGLDVAARLALRRQKVARRGAGRAAELARIALGRSEVAPPKGDRRFKDPAWDGNPAFKRLAQAYLAL